MGSFATASRNGNNQTKLTGKRAHTHTTAEGKWTRVENKAWEMEIIGATKKRATQSKATAHTHKLSWHKHKRQLQDKISTKRENHRKLTTQQHSKRTCKTLYIRIELKQCAKYGNNQKHQPKQQPKAPYRQETQNDDAKAKQQHNACIMGRN